MPKVRAVDEMNETELRAELVSLLADGCLTLHAKRTVRDRSRGLRIRSRFRDSLP
jgi:hypothetical protein